MRIDFQIWFLTPCSVEESISFESNLMIDYTIVSKNRILKNCQRHNGPEGWVHLSKVTYRVPRKFKHRSWSNFIFKISTKHLLQNLNQTSPSRLNLKFKILTKPSFSISIKIQLRNLCKTSAAKYWKSCLNFNIKSLNKPCAQSLNKKLALLPSFSSQVCIKLLPTRSSSSGRWHHSQPSSLLNVTELVS